MRSAAATARLSAPQDRTVRAAAGADRAGLADRARRQLAEYGEGYLRVVRRALGESQRGEQQRQQRLATLEKSRRQVAELQDRLARCREFLDPAVGPQAS